MTAPNGSYPEGAEALLPCPFCGGPAVEVGFEFVTCGNPDLEGLCIGKSVQAETAAEWNRRTGGVAQASLTGAMIEGGAKALCLAQFGDEATHGDARCCQVGGKDGCCLHEVRKDALACLEAALSALSSTQCAVTVCTCRPGPCAFPSPESK